MSVADALMLHASDTVAVMLRDVAAGARVRIRNGDRFTEVTAREPIPLGHKMAVIAAAEGAAVMKYGSVIALASRTLSPGDHVHIHNIVSQRVSRRS